MAQGISANKQHSFSKTFTSSWLSCLCRGNLLSSGVQFVGDVEIKDQNTNHRQPGANWPFWAFKKIWMITQEKSNTYSHQHDLRISVFSGIRGGQWGNNKKLNWAADKETKWRRASDLQCVWFGSCSSRGRPWGPGWVVRSGALCLRGAGFVFVIVRLLGTVVQHVDLGLMGDSDGAGTLRPRLAVHLHGHLGALENQLEGQITPNFICGHLHVKYNTAVLCLSKNDLYRQPYLDAA